MDDDQRRALLTAMYRHPTRPRRAPETTTTPPPGQDRHTLTDAAGSPVEVPSLALVQSLQSSVAQHAETIRHLAPAEAADPRRLANLERRLAETERVLRKLDQSLSHLRQQMTRTGRHLTEMEGALNGKLDRRDPS